ncbi:MAG TPA: molybdopterin cofactor-binding domain-containing protein [Burkholderiaceae bacterium]|nr:molybdopterin cofactor-binding domain-containing protein [Burkholderiaceae bacterium]
MTPIDTPPAAPSSRRRRVFLIGTGIVGAALTVGVYRFYRPRDHLSPPSALRPTPDETVLTGWIKLASDGQVTVQVPRQEMGQGVVSTLALLVAEELDADPAQVRFEEAPIDAIYVNATMIGDSVPFRPDDRSVMARFNRFSQFKLGELLGVQATGGSTSVRDAWRPMRQAGAVARAMLVQAAAGRFAVPPDSLSVAGGVVEHKASGRRATFGELAVEAGRQPMPRDVPLKDPERFTLLGKPQRRLDIPAKVDGSARFGIDTRIVGMAYAAIAQCPVFGGALESFDASKVKGRRGVVDVFDIPATSTSAAAVVVVADHYWLARSALADVTMRWNEGPNAGFDTASQRKRYEQLLEQGDARVYDHAGDLAAAEAGAATRVTADYFVPYLAHATMEPINCTAVVRQAGSCEVWVGSQAPTLVRWFAARAAGVDSEKVTVHTPYLGGGFGRRFEVDVVVQAVTIARRVTDTPVQLIWSREEDMTHDVYRPMAAARMRAALDAKGNVASWYHRIVGQSCTGSLTARLLPAAASDLMKDKTTTEGAFDLPYALPNRVVEHVLTHEPVPVGYWRSVGHSYNAFFAESFVDECAAAAGQDPVAFRLALLADAPRFRKVLEVAAEKAGWDTPPPAGRARGVALAESFQSIVAQVAEVEIVDGAPRVRRVVCAVDCGFAVNPDVVAAQMESAIIFGLTAALFGEITLKAGRVEQSNFPAYDMVRLASAPAIEVHIVNSGVEHLGGIGEPGTPPIAPAVCNALFKLTGKRIRSLPIRL